MGGGVLQSKGGGPCRSIDTLGRTQSIKSSASICKQEKGSKASLVLGLLFRNLNTARCACNILLDGRENIKEDGLTEGFLDVTVDGELTSSL